MSQPKPIEPDTTKLPADRSFTKAPPNEQELQGKSDRAIGNTRSQIPPPEPEVVKVDRGV